MRALFEMSLTSATEGSEMSERLLEWCKMLERQLWDTQHILRHFCDSTTFLNPSSIPENRFYRVGQRKDRETVSDFEEACDSPVYLQFLTSSGDMFNIFSIVHTTLYDSPGLSVTEFLHS